MAELRIKFTGDDYGRQLGEVRKSIRQTGAGVAVRKRAWGVAITGADERLVDVKLQLGDEYAFELFGTLR